jgi:hypothetical protein
MDALSVICKQEPVLRGYAQPCRFVGSIKSQSRLNQERTGCGAQDGQGAPYSDFLGFPLSKEYGNHSLALRIRSPMEPKDKLTPSIVNPKWRIPDSVRIHRKEH